MPLANWIYEITVILGWIVTIATVGYWLMELPALLQDSGIYEQIQDGSSRA